MIEKKIQALIHMNEKLFRQTITLKRPAPSSKI